MSVRIVWALLSLFWLETGGAAPSGADTALIEAGRQIYEQGLLPDGSPLRAKRPEGFVLEGEHAACTVCHRRSGMGSIEGRVVHTILVPPIAGPVLLKPARFASSFLDHSHHYVPNEAWARALTRPAYDEVSFARALSQGVDPAGKALISPMPTYQLDKKSIRALMAYLRQLNSAPTPGMTDGRLHVATVITPDVSEAQAEAVLGVVRAWVRAMRPLGKPMQLHEWRLSGDEADWPQQLALKQKQQPVFALLSGAGTTRWQAVAQFCEANALPCLLPALESAPENGDGFYALYFSPGVNLEARMLARHLLDEGDKNGVSQLVQVYADDTGRQAVQHLRAQSGLESGANRDRRLPLSAPTTALRGLSNADSLMLWLRPAELQDLMQQSEPPAVKRIYLSAMLAPPETVVLPASWKRKVAYVSLFDDISIQNDIARVRLQKWLQQRRLPVPADLRLQADAYAACYLFNAALGKIRAQELRRPAVPVSAEQVLEMLETLVEKYSDGTEQVNPDSHVAFYGRMSLGPQQRMAVRGGTILRFGAPSYDSLVADGARIVP